MITNIVKLLIVEDEIPNQQLLSGMVHKLRPEWKVVGCTDSVSETVEWLSEQSADLIFMDIQLSDGICFSVFERLEITTPVIFTTAYDNYAISAFKVNSIDYLLKPIKESELRYAIEKFEKQTTTKPSDLNISDLLEAVKNGVKKYRTRLLVHGAKAYYKIEVDNVAYFYSFNKITFARLFDKSDHVVDHTLEELEYELNPDIFFRASRNLIVNIKSIVSFEDYFGGKLVLKLSPPFEESVTVSRLKNRAFKEWVGK